MVGSHIGGRYRILAELGRGAFGQTYLAEDMRIPGNPKCVVKQLKPQAEDQLTLREARRLFNNEAAILSKLEHRQIPRLLAHYQESFHLVQEFIEGEDLSEEIYPGKKWSEAEVTSMLLDILPVLEFIHRKNVIHRDIKPSNILRRKSDQRLVLIDFGAVKEIQTLVIGAGGKPKPSIVVGTRGYMPTEQLQGRPRPNSDIYALGIMAILALTGLALTELEEDDDSGEIIWREQAHVSRRLGNIISKMVQSHCTRRYQSATDVLKDLGVKSSGSYVPDSSVIRLSVWRRKWLVWGLIGTVVSAGILLFPYARGIYLFNKAHGLRKAGQYSQAVDIYKEVHKIYPQSDKVLVVLGYTYGQKQLFDQQLRTCDKALTIKPKNVEALNCRGLALDRLGRHEEALEAYNQVLDLQPDLHLIWNNKGETLMRLEKYDEALDAFDRAIAIKPEYKFGWNNRGNALSKLGKYSLAIASYDEALEIDPDYIYPLNGRGNAKRNRGDYEEAIEDYNQALSINDKFYEAWYNKGLALRFLGQNQEAFDAFDEAVKIKPNYGPAIEQRDQLRRRLN